MPQPNKLISDADSLIAVRIREARIRQRLSQRDLATKAKVTLNQIAGIEYGRVVLRFAIGCKICDVLSANPQWIVEGKNPEFPWHEISSDLINKADQNGSFLEEYYRVLKPAFDDVWDRLQLSFEPSGEPPDYSEMLANFPPVGTPDDEAAWFFVIKRIQLARNWIKSPDLQLKLLDKITSALEDFNREHGAEVRSAHSQWIAANRSMQEVKPDTGQASLDILQTILQPAFDMATLDQWIKRLRKVCERRGAMSELARKLNVSRQAIAQWLTTDPEVRTRPSGELVLPLLEWVQAEEANQQKNSASVAAPAEPKTRRKTNNNEDQTSGRRKK